VGHRATVFGLAGHFLHAAGYQQKPAANGTERKGEVVIAQKPNPTPGMWVLLQKTLSGLSSAKMG
jgi:hypothetical protein